MPALRTSPVSKNERLKPPQVPILIFPGRRERSPNSTGCPCGGASEGAEASGRTVHFGREGDRVWMCCHRICGTSTQPVTSAGIASHREPKGDAHQSHEIPQKGIRSLEPLSFTDLSGLSTGLSTPMSCCVAGTT